MLAAAISSQGSRQLPPLAGFPVLEDLPVSRLRVKRGRTLFYAGDEFNAIYSIRFGSFKLCIVDAEGRQQVTAFAMRGDVLGLEAIGTGRHGVSAVALEDSEVVVLPFAAVERAAREAPTLQRHLHALMAREIVSDHGVMMLLGSLNATGRIAAFLLGLSQRHQRLGYSSADFHLRMGRADIASYLGLKIETVSRTFTLLDEQGIIEVNDKHIRILNRAGLERLWKGSDRVR